MKTHTRVSAKLESIGKPIHTVELHGETVREVTLAIAKWLTTAYMGSHMRITIARTPTELKIFTTRSAGSTHDKYYTDLTDELNAILDSPELPILEHDDESSHHID